MSDDDDKGKKGKNKKVMVLGIVAIAGAAYKFVLAPKPSDAVADGEAVEEVAEGDVAAVPELVVNLADTEEVHYVRIGVAVVLEEGVDPKAFETRMPIVSDVVIDIVSSKTFAEVRGAGATAKLKEEISKAARDAFDGEEVVRVIFTTFVTQ